MTGSMEAVLCRCCCDALGVSEIKGECPQSICDQCGTEGLGYLVDVPLSPPTDPHD